MRTATGIFPSRASAEMAREKLVSNGFTEDHVILLSAGASQSELDSIPTEDTEQPGMGKAIGGVVGCAVGLAAGAGLANLILPGVGPIVALGLGAGGLGAAAGASGGNAHERMVSKGLPKDEIFLYEDALREGRSLVIALSTDENLLKLGRDILDQNGAEAIDAAREKWWIGLRDAEAEQYNSRSEEIFEDVEQAYRRGFEAAQELELRGKALEEAEDALRQRFGGVVGHEAFRRGYARGQDHALKKPAGKRN